MTNKKTVSLIIFSLLSILVVLIYLTNSATKVYADEDAPVVTTDATSGTRKAPVSIATYSDVITESSDTYNYRNQPTSDNEIDDNNTFEATQEPTVGTLPVETPQPGTQESKKPVGTGSPDATEEPDIISYPPTEAPPYKD